MKQELREERGKINTTYKSNCCNCFVMVYEGDEGTNYFECSACHKPCDIHRATMEEIRRDMKKKEIIYFRESLIQSVLSDIVSFGFIIGGLLFNKFVLSGKWYIDIFFMLLFLILSLSKVNSKKQTFTSKEELLKYLESQAISK